MRRAGTQSRPSPDPPIRRRRRPRFIGEAPYADIVEDEFPSDLVHVVQRKAELTAAALGNLPHEWQVRGEDLDESCRRAIEYAWQAALRELWLVMSDSDRGD